MNCCENRDKHLIFVWSIDWFFFSFYVDLHATPNIGTPKPAKSETADDDEPPLNEDDDDDDDLDDLDQGEDETSTYHLVLAQFDKVIMTAMS